MWRRTNNGIGEKLAVDRYPTTSGISHLSNDTTGLVAARAGALKVSGGDVDLLDCDNAAGLVGARA